MIGCCVPVPRPQPVEFADILSQDGKSSGKFGVTSNKKIRKSRESDEEEEEYKEQRQHLEIIIRQNLNSQSPALTVKEPFENMSDTGI